MVMFAEVRENGKWHKVGKEFTSTYEELMGQLTDRVFDGRNVHLLSFLSENSIPGFPYDASDEIKNHVVFKHYSSMHHITLKDLLDLDWDKESCQYGYISEWQYERLKNNGIEPVSIIKNLLGRDVTTVSPFLMDMIIANPSLRQDTKYLVEYKYDKHIMKELCDFFCNVSIPGLIKLIPEGGLSEHVRVIFSF